MALSCQTSAGGPSTMTQMETDFYTTLFQIWLAIVLEDERFVQICQWEQKYWGVLINLTYSYRKYLCSNIYDFEWNLIPILFLFFRMHSWWPWRPIQSIVNKKMGTGASKKATADAEKASFDDDDTDEDFDTYSKKKVAANSKSFSRHSVTMLPISVYLLTLVLWYWYKN